MTRFPPQITTTKGPAGRSGSSLLIQRIMGKVTIRLYLAMIIFFLRCNQRLFPIIPIQIVIRRTMVVKRPVNGSKDGSTCRFDKKAVVGCKLNTDNDDHDDDRDDDEINEGHPDDSLFCLVICHFNRNHSLRVSEAEVQKGLNHLREVIKKINGLFTVRLTVRV